VSVREIATLALFVAAGPAGAAAQDFVLGPAGCPMAHCDGRMSDLAGVPAPGAAAGVLWRSDVAKGSHSGLGCAANGVIAACTFNDEAGDNVAAYDYDGRRLWSSAGLINATAWGSAPMVSLEGSVIAADDSRIVRFDPGGRVVWNTPTPGGRPTSPVPTENGLAVIATFRGPLSAYDPMTGALVGQHTLRRDDGSRPSFSTTNTPCVRGSRIYVVAEKDGLNLGHEGRLVALDVDRSGFREVWHVAFGAPSGTSPLAIGGVVYFGGQRPAPGFGSPAEPTLFAVRDRGDHGEIVWTHTVESGRPVLASLAQDPRGGMWFFGAGGLDVIRVAEADGAEIERISIDELVARPEPHGPGSAITIAGPPAEPVMVVAAKTYFGSSFVVAVDLQTRSLVWKALLSSRSAVNRGSTSGQFPILLGPHGPRVVFSSWDLGVFGVGESASPR
jgi:hypothetical protein